MILLNDLWVLILSIRTTLKSCLYSIKITKKHPISASVYTRTRYKELKWQCIRFSGQNDVMYIVQCRLGVLIVSKLFCHNIAIEYKTCVSCLFLPLTMTYPKNVARKTFSDQTDLYSFALEIFIIMSFSRFSIYGVPFLYL